MLFAIYDYIQYRLMLGPYSEESIKAQNGIICSAENIYKYLGVNAITQEQIGMIFLHTRVSFLSWIVMYYTTSLWSHVGILLSDGNVYEATTNQGVTINPSSTYIDNQSFFHLIKIPVPNAEAKEAMQKEMRNMYGYKYDWFSPFKIFLYIIIAAKSEWKIKYSLDIFITLIALFFTKLISLSTFIVLISIYSIPLYWNLIKCKYHDFRSDNNARNNPQENKNFIERYHMSKFNAYKIFTRKTDKEFQIKQADFLMILFTFAPYSLLLLELNQYIYILLLIWSVFCILFDMIAALGQKMVYSPYSNPFDSATAQVFFFFQVLINYAFAHYSVYLFDHSQYIVSINEVNLFDMFYYTVVTATTLGDNSINAAGTISKSLVIAELFCGLWFIFNAIPLQLAGQAERFKQAREKMEDIINKQVKDK